MQTRKISVTAVSYLNTKPLLYGIIASGLAEQIDLQLDIPSVCAQKLKAGQVDLGLVPVAVIPELSSPHIISDYCIGSEGAVRTVAVFADRPLEQLKRIFLDHHSRTSVELIRVLLREYWQVEPVLTPASEGYIGQIRGATGGLVIGDRAIGLEQRHPYVYDLGAAWTDHTGLPFVYAAWVSNRQLAPEFLLRFNLALHRGLLEIPQLIYLLPPPHPGFDLQTYFTRHISYEFNADKRRALALFFKKTGWPLPAALAESLRAVDR